MKFFKRSTKDEQATSLINEENVISLTPVEEDETGASTNTYTYPDQSEFDVSLNASNNLSEEGDASEAAMPEEDMPASSEDLLLAAEDTANALTEVHEELSCTDIEAHEGSAAHKLSEDVQADLPACVAMQEDCAVPEHEEPSEVEASSELDKDATLVEGASQEAEEGALAVEAVPGSKASESKEKPVNHSQKARKRLMVVIGVLLVALVALVCTTVFVFMQSSEQAKEEAAHQGAASIEQHNTADARFQGSKSVQVPKLASLLGMSKEDALKTLGDKAVVGSEAESSEKSSKAVKTLTIPLALDDEEDYHTAAPVVYLGLDADDKVVSVGFGSSTTLLGFAPTSFVDAIKSEHIIEKLMSEAGFTLGEDQIKLPEKSDEYTQVNAETGVVENEQYSFNGTLKHNNAELTWSATLSYDYSAANASGNLNDTIRQIVISVSEA